MAPKRIITVTLAAMMTLTLLGGVAAASPDTLDCDDDTGINSVTDSTVGLQDHEDDGGGGSLPDCPHGQYCGPDKGGPSC